MKTHMVNNLLVAFSLRLTGSATALFWFCYKLRTIYCREQRLTHGYFPECFVCIPHSSKYELSLVSLITITLCYICIFKAISQLSVTYAKSFYSVPQKKQQYPSVHQNMIDTSLLTITLKTTRRRQICLLIFRFYTSVYSVSSSASQTVNDKKLLAACTCTPLLRHFTAFTTSISGTRALVSVCGRLL